MEHWDIIIIGAGPAGLTAGIYAARSGLKTLILEDKIPGGLAAEAPLIENYPGFLEGISGLDLVNKMVKHAKKFGVQINEFEKAVKLNLEGEEKVVKTDKNVYASSALIISSGCHRRTLGVTGEGRLRGRGVSYCALCDGPLFKGKRVIVVGGGNSAAVSAIYLSNLASDIKLVHRRGALRAEEALTRDLKRKKVGIVLNTVVKEIKGNAVVERVVLSDKETGETKEVEVDGVFIQVGEVPNTQIAKEAGVEIDGNGYIIVDAHQRTNMGGVYAAGDVTDCPVKQVGTAVGQAIVAVTEAFGYVKRPYWWG